MDWESAFKWIGAILVATFGWMWRRQATRLDALEKDRVTRTDFDELRASMLATFTNGHNRLEDKLDRIIERLMK